MNHHKLSIKHICLALLSGGLLTLAFPRFNISILAWIGLVPLLFALERTSSLRSSFTLGWICGLAYFGGTLYWIVDTMAVYGHIPLWQSVLISLALVSYLSLYIGGFALVWNWLRRGFPPLASLLIAGLAWTSVEFLRAHVLTGFPWSSLGYSQYSNLQLIQFADITGIYGLSFVISLVNGGLAALLENLLAKITNGRTARLGPSSLIWTCVILIAVIGLVESYGAYRLHTSQGKSAEGVLNVGIIQGNIPQEDKWNRQLQDIVYGAYQSLTLLAAEQKPDLIIWPETSAPFINERYGDYLERISPLVQKAGVAMVVGSPRIERDEATGEVQLRNSAFFLAPDGKILDYYDKIHLVPFGEYLPLGEILSHLGSVVNEVGEFSPGERHTIFHLDCWRFGLVICYEAIFPDLFREFARQGVNFMVNITNDAWFDRSSAPYQHFSMAIFRAIENGISVVRVANTGISGLIDPWGRVILETPLFRRLALVRPLPLLRRDTFYVRHGDLFARSCLAALGLWLLLGCGRAYRTKKMEG